MDKYILYIHEFDRTVHTFELVIYEKTRLGYQNRVDIEALNLDTLPAMFILFEKLFPMSTTITHKEFLAIKTIYQTTNEFDMQDIIFDITKHKIRGQIVYDYADILANVDRETIINGLAGVTVTDNKQHIMKLHKQRAASMIAVTIDDAMFGMHTWTHWNVFIKLFPQFYRIEINTNELAALKAIQYFYQYGTTSLEELNKYATMSREELIEELIFRYVMESS